MRLYIISIFLLFQSSLLICQNTFELQIPWQGYQTPGDIVIDNQGNYIISGLSYDFSLGYHNGIIFKVNATGEVVKSISYFVPDSTCWFGRIIKLDSNYLVFGGIGPISSGWTSIMICSFDFELNFQWRKNYLLSGEHELATIRAKVDYDNNIILLGSATKDVKYNDPDPFLFKCNQQGDSLKMVVHSFEYFQLLYDFLIKSDSSGYISFAYGRYPGYPSYHSSGAHYSNTYSLVDVTEIPDESFHSTHTAKWINDHEFLISGNKNLAIQYTAYQGVGLKWMDTSFSILHELDYAHFLDTISYPGWERSFDWLNFNDIFFTWSKNYDDFYQTMPSWIVVTKLDSNFNIIYDRYYGGDAMYSSYFIEATEDGGCVILGIVYKYQGYDYDLYLIKTDENGLVTAIDEDQLQSQLNILVYPNPCRERISFDHDLTLVDIFDQKGQLVLRYQNYNQFSNIAVGQLQSGVYIYRALSKEGGYASGKFVKK
jgi:hypothetical protein